MQRKMGNWVEQSSGPQPRQVLFSFLMLLFCGALTQQTQYSIPEEMTRGSLVGNLAEDLGLHKQDLLTSRNLRVNTEKQYFTVNKENGNILVSDRIDRESLCLQSPLCVVPLEIVAQNPLNVFHINVMIEDINDNPPHFPQNSTVLQVNELALPGTRFGLESAIDVDVGPNSLQSYQLSYNEYFSLIVKDKIESNNAPELVLEKPLDREEQNSYLLILTAVDGGNPIRTGTTRIKIQVTDANDNPPVFSQDVYKVSLQENVSPGTFVFKVTATDRDEGINAEVIYSFKTPYNIGNMFMLDSQSGEIKSNDPIDFEIRSSYIMGIEAKDGGGMTAECKLIIEILDENDNVPEVLFTSVSSSITEDAEPGTVTALFKTHDKDSRENGEVTCFIKGNVPFRIQSSANNYYKLVTDGALDREQIPIYNLTIMVTDRGQPPLSSSITITLHIGDVNDNPPVFAQPSYLVQVEENNPPGASIAQVSASDPDLGPNGRVSYSIVGSDLAPRALASFVSLSAQSGVLFAQRAFDHEQLRGFALTLQARDQGSPARSANVSLRVLVGDRNDNAPRVLYPALGPDGSALFDTVPRAAQPGYLVTKVVAVDADAGHNAWLSYHVLQASEPGLFDLGLRTGEVRLARPLGDRDAARQRLLVAVRDGGRPPLSATATLLLVFADSPQEVPPDHHLGERPPRADPQAELQFYLVLALAFISVLFLLAVILAVALRLRSSSSQEAWGCFQAGVCSKSAPAVAPNYSEGTLPYSYNLCVASQSAKTEFNFLSINPENVLPEDVSDEASLFQAPPNTDWRFSQAQRPGTSGSQNGDETGTWPNNQFDTEMLQAMILASASEAADGSSTLGGGAGTMGLSARYGPQFTLQHVPDYRQNVYIPGSNATLTNAAGKRDGKAAAGGNGNKKKSGKKEKK
ncbi:protocadherin gamma-B2 isoform X23 [Erinaceus europaeus]|uniref:Protocadherin gamma-B2 isoform X23 n=1 Tax=Erinaceus europaeus TaxID=9365 RepID=A0ABM3WH09_ERIEU|nr:protocadherin gamma-B2 isoform X23 [Erinaceus europaeus]